MATYHGPFRLRGSVGDLTFYQRRDQAHSAARQKTSLNKKRIDTDPAFAGTRRAGTEKGGRSTAAKAIRRVLRPLEPVRTGNWQGFLTGRLTPVEFRDTESLRGQRGVLLSRHGHLLNGLALSRKTPFDSLLSAPLSYSLDRATRSARLEVPALLPGVNFFPNGKLPYFRLVATLGIAPDFIYTPYGYQPQVPWENRAPEVVQSNWFHVQAGSPALSWVWSLPYTPENEAYGLLLAVGVLLGTVEADDTIRAKGYQGSGRILEVK